MSAPRLLVDGCEALRFRPESPFCFEATLALVCEDSVVALTAALVACDCLYGLPYLLLEGREAKLWCRLLSAFYVEEPLMTRVEVPQLLMMRATSKNLAVLNFFTMFCSFDF